MVSWFGAEGDLKPIIDARHTQQHHVLFQSVCNSLKFLLLIQALVITTSRGGAVLLAEVRNCNNGNKNLHVGLAVMQGGLGETKSCSKCFVLLFG